MPSAVGVISRKGSAINSSFETLGGKDSDMKSHGRYRVYLRGSRKHIERTIYEDENGKCFVKWYGNLIEVKRGNGGTYGTVEMY